MDYFFLAPLVLGFCSAIALLFKYRVASRDAKQQSLWEQEQRARDKAWEEGIEADLLEWIKMLKLPHLEDLERLEAAARHLRIVLVDLLLRGRRVR